MDNLVKEGVLSKIGNDTYAIKKDKVYFFSLLIERTLILVVFFFPFYL